MKGIYRVSSVRLYPEGHTFQTRQGSKVAGPNHHVTTWDIVVASGSLQAIFAATKRAQDDGAEISRVFSVNHMGDITAEGE